MLPRWWSEPVAIGKEKYSIHDLRVTKRLSPGSVVNWMIRPSSSGHSECSERSIQNVKLCHKGQICIPHAAAAAVNDDINNDDDVNNDDDDDTGPCKT